MTDRVLIVFCARDTTGQGGGGIHNAVLAQVHALRSVGIDVTVWTASLACANAAKALGATALLDPKIHSGSKPLKDATIRAEARKLRPTLRAAIHHSGRTWLWGGVLFPSIPHAQVLHRERLGSYRYFRNWIALNRSRVETVGKRFWHRIGYAPNGMRPDFPIPDTAPVRPEAGRFHIAALGRDDPLKGFDILLNAIAALRAQGIDATATIGGCGPERFKDQLSALDLTNHVRFAGEIDDVASFMDRADVFAHPSRIEQFGLVLLEAMARGLPCVATETKGALDIITEGETGHLIAIDDTAALTARLAALAADPAKRAQMGSKALARVRDVFSPEAVGRQTIACLTEFGATFAPLSTESTAT